MRRIRLQLTMLVAAAISLWAGVAVSAQQTAPSRVTPAVPSPEPPVEPPIERRFESEHWQRPIFRLGQGYTLPAGDVVREVVVIFGDATIQGRVDRDVVVVLGKAQLANTAVIEGSLIVIGGSALVAPGALLYRDLVVVAGAVDAPPGFSTGGQQVVIGPASLGGRLEAVVPWIFRGLLWGRPIVPDLPWVWSIVGISFIVYLLLNLMLRRPVRACAERLADKPMTVFVVGLLVLLLAGPVCLLLAASVIGLAVVPFVLCALFVAVIVGKVGVARWIGMSVVHEDSPESQLQSLRSFAIGFGVICLAYMIPVLGLVTWTMVGLFGLGASTLAFLAAYRQENPAPPPRVPPDVAPAPVAHHYAPPPPPSYDYTAPPAPHQSADAAAQIPDGPAIGLSESAASAAPPPASVLASFPHAAFLDRAAAFVLDVILVVIAREVLDLTTRDNESTFFLLLLAYHIGFWTWKGTTVGGIICQLRVVRVDGAPLRFVDALVRGLSSIFSLAVLGLGCLWILRDPERQAWHDRIAGTYVVKVPRNWPI